jgi:hypothetical protein
MTKQKLSVEEQEKQRQDEVNAVRSLCIYNALEMLNKGQHRITDFFYANPTKSGINGLNLNQGEDSFIVGRYKVYDHYVKEMVNMYVIISEKVSIALHYPMTICDKVAEAYMKAERDDKGRLNRVNEEDIKKLRYFLASIFGIC